MLNDIQTERNVQSQNTSRSCFRFPLLMYFVIISDIYISLPQTCIYYLKKLTPYNTAPSREPMSINVAFATSAINLGRTVLKTYFICTMDIE